MWVDGEAKAGDPGRTLGLPLSAVSGAHRKVAYGIKGSKIRLMLDVYVNADGQPVPGTAGLAVPEWVFVRRATRRRRHASRIVMWEVGLETSVLTWRPGADQRDCAQR